VLVAVSITETMPELVFVMAATYTLVPAEFTATPRGLPAIGTVATTVLVDVSIRDTLLLSEFEMYARTAHGLPVGVAPSTVLSTAFALTPAVDAAPTSANGVMQAATSDTRIKAPRSKMWINGWSGLPLHPLGSFWL
jgi:hypothetical protein